MKKIIALALLPFILSACGSDEYVHSTEPRSNVYYGQPIADLYENFGAPTKATRLTENERVLIYIKQEIEKDWAYRYVRGCVMKFYLKDERVIAWSADGQACVIPSTGGNITEVNVQNKNTGIAEEGFGLFDGGAETSMTEYSLTGGQVPADAFDGKADTKYDAVRGIKGNTLSGKASDEQQGGYQLPADAFDGKASTTYHSIKTPITNKSASQGYTVPADAFDGKASTVYHPVKSETGKHISVSSSSASMLPADAFDGKASTVYHQPTQSNKTSQSWLSADEDDWGLFDN